VSTARAAYGAATTNSGNRRNTGSTTGDNSTNHRKSRRYQVALSASVHMPAAGGSCSGKNQNSSLASQASPPISMDGTAIADSTQSDGNSRRSRLSTASGPDRSSDAAIIEPASANITDIAGKMTVSADHPVTW
jgi:hypothetical protein